MNLRPRIASMAAVVVTATVTVLWSRYSKAKKEGEKLAILQSKELIAPSELIGNLKEGGTIEPISEIDESLAMYWIGVAFRYDCLLDPAQVKTGLAMALDHFPAVASRYQPATDSSRSHLLLDKDNCGVDFEVSLDKNYINNMSKITSFEDLQYIEKTSLPSEANTLQEWVDADLFTSSVKRVTLPGIDDALFEARLTVFPLETVSYLSFTCNHVLGDANSLYDFLEVWTKCSRGYTFFGPAAPLGERVSSLNPSIIAHDKELLKNGDTSTPHITSLPDSENRTGKSLVNYQKNFMSKKWEEIVNPLQGSSPFNITKWSFFFNFLWNRFRNSEIEYEVDLEKLRSMADQLNSQVQEGTEVTRLNTLVAILLSARGYVCYNEGLLSETDFSLLESAATINNEKAEAANDKDNKHIGCWETNLSSTIVNARERTKEFSPYYFGNALRNCCRNSPVYFPLQISDNTGERINHAQKTWLFKTAAAYHEVLAKAVDESKAVLEGKSDVENNKGFDLDLQWREEVRDLGMSQELVANNIVMSALNKFNGVLCVNSWMRFDWCGLKLLPRNLNPETPSGNENSSNNNNDNSGDDNDDTDDSKEENNEDSTSGYTAKNTTNNKRNDRNKAKNKKSKTKNRAKRGNFKRFNTIHPNPDNRSNSDNNTNNSNSNELESIAGDEKKQVIQEEIEEIDDGSVGITAIHVANPFTLQNIVNEYPRTPNTCTVSLSMPPRKLALFKQFIKGNNFPLREVN